MIVSKVSSSRIRTMSSTGIAAAPVTASRSDDRSYSGRRGWSRIVWKRVGGPGSIVICSRCTRSSTSSTSNTACGWIVAPVNIAASHPALYPKAWKNGLTMR